MRKTAEKYIEQYEAPATPISVSREILAAIILGLGSIALYVLLYVFNDEIRQFAEMTYKGDHTYFLLPIAIAFVFSAVHGAFTGRFWDALGLQAKT